MTRDQTPTDTIPDSLAAELVRENARLRADLLAALNRLERIRELADDAQSQACSDAFDTLTKIALMTKPRE